MIARQSDGLCKFTQSNRNYLNLTNSREKTENTKYQIKLLNQFKDNIQSFTVIYYYLKFDYLLTNCMIHLKGIETFDSVTHGIHLNRVFLSWGHIRHFRFRFSNAGQLYPSWIILRSIAYRKFGIQRIGRCLPMHDNRVARYLLDAQILWWVRHCDRTIVSITTREK